MSTEPDNTRCRFRRELMVPADARMQLPTEELRELEVEQPDGSFKESNPVITTDKYGKHGILKAARLRALLVHCGSRRQLGDVAKRPTD